MVNIRQASLMRPVRLIANSRTGAAVLPVRDAIRNAIRSDFYGEFYYAVRDSALDVTRWQQ